MNFRFITLFPELIEAGLSAGVVGQAAKHRLFSTNFIQPRSFTADVHRAVDDRPFGGGDGMIMMPEILEASVTQARSLGATRVIYLSPQGTRFDDAGARRLAREESVTLVCGRYGGIDERALHRCVDEELSIGDYVLSGGELAALVVVDAVARRLPGVLGHQDSAEKDSFADGLLEHPHFTRPREWRGEAVPSVLMSGHHGRIEEWKKRLSQLVTLKKRPDLFAQLPAEERRQALDYWGRMSPEERIVCGFGNWDAAAVFSR